VPMKVYPVPDKYLTDMLDTDGSLYREAFGDNTLRFESHEETYMTEGFC
jgi:hypothetical protein